jgi:serine/threonine protein kinase
MIGPSAFFTPDTHDDIFIGTDHIELIHTSDNGFNELYRCNKNGRFFIYKVLKKEHRGKPLYEQLLKKEFNIGISLNHVGIRQYFGFTNVPSLGNCIVMEWIDGKTLESRIKEGSIDKAIVKKIIFELCDALEHIHKKQVIHRDLKPENIMITDNGNNVKIIDFGLADADSYNSLKAPAGTRYYASPELLAGEPVDARTDIWSLGMIINELTKRYRYVSACCLRRNRNKRYSSAADVKNGIRNARFRRIKHIVLIFGIVTSATTVTYFTVTDKVSTEIQSLTEPTGDTIKAPAQVIMTPEQPVTTSEPQAESKEKPAAKSSEMQPADNINASELDQLFKDAASSIL